MKVSDYIASFLYARQVTHIFEVLGGMTTHLIDSIYRQGNIRIISVHHEQAAGFAADGMARVSGVPGVAIATSGPGAINLLTGVASCYFDSVPAVFITGQVNLNEQRGSRSIRQLGFQETDIAAMAAPVTKEAWRVGSPDQVPSLLANAFELALSGRPGPVLLDIPMDVQYANIQAEVPVTAARADTDRDRPDGIEELLNGLEKAKRPLILAGGGVRAARAVQRFREFVDKVQVPVVNSLMMVDALPQGHPMRVGLIGTYGNRWANLAIGRSDFLLVLGSRLDIRQTGSDTEFLKLNRTIYHVDCEPGEINNRVSGCRGIVADLRAFLDAAIELAPRFKPQDLSAWLHEIDESRRTWPDTGELQNLPGINPNDFLHQLSRRSRRASAFVVDVGQHQMWAAQSVDLSDDQHFLTSGGLGAMGFALPAAVGVALLQPQRPTIVIAGDGGFQLNLQELETLQYHHLPIKIVLLHNKCYGMPRQFQQTYFDGRYPGTLWGYSAPDFVGIAKAYGIEACAIDSPGEVQSALAAMWREPLAPFLLQVMIDPSANAYPKIAFGRPITDMEPMARPTAMEST